MKNTFLLLSLLLTTSIFAQKFNRLSFSAEKNGKNLLFPFTGGQNAPQFNTADLNQDGKLDLVVFDRIGNIVSTYLNGGTANKTDYAYAPQFVENFPKMREWLVMRDFNGDGAADIFTYSDTNVDGISVWKGFYENKNLKFKRIVFKGMTNNVLPFYLNNTPINLYVSGQDYPEINDIDGDGDLDVLTFENGGGSVDWYKNMAKEENLSKDSLLFILEDKCWGKFYESGLTKQLDLSISPNKCFSTVKGELPERGGLHAGSTLLSYDKDGDGDMEILLGDISFKNINLGINGGTKSAAWINSQDNVFPDPDMPVNMDIFPASFMFDANNDGKKDYFAAPNNINSSEDVNNAWYYENVGTSSLPVFEFRKKNFLTEDMLDFGSNTIPTFADIDADGLTDIIVGVGFSFKNNIDVEGRLVFLKNIGTKTNPKYRIEDDNWLNFSQLKNNSYYFAPAFGDLDDDGDQDLFVGDNSGGMFYLENTAGASKAMLFDANKILNNFPYQNIDIGQNATPQIVDLNRDGLKDFVLGESNGILFFMKNIGTKTVPKFNPDKKSSINIDTLGGVNVKEFGNSKGFAAPYLLDLNGKFNLFVANLNGKIARFTNIDKNLSGKFTQIDPDFGQIREGFYESIAMNDIDNNGFLDVLVGNQRGGLAFYQSNLKTDGSTNTTDFFDIKKIQIAPNPASSSVNICFENPNYQQYNIQIINCLGQLVHQESIVTERTDISVQNWAKGLYFVRIFNEKGELVQKIVKE